MGYRGNILKASESNTDFRRVLYSTDRTQLVVMSVGVGEDIGMEVHDLDQVLVFVSGQGDTILEGSKAPVGPGDAVVVPAGAMHNVLNTGDEPLKLYTIYAPPEHADGTVHKTREEAELAEAQEHAHAAEGQVAAPAGPTFTVGSLRGQG